MKLTRTRECGDATAWYDVEFNGTFKQLVDEILSQKEWGSIDLCFKTSYLTVAEYRGSYIRYGEMEYLNAHNVFDRKVKAVKANGGWGLMDYYVTLAPLVVNLKKRRR